MIARLKHAAPARQLGLVLLILAALVTLIGSFDQHPGMDMLHFIKQTFDDFYTNVGTELASIAITVLIIDRLNERRSDEHHKEELVLQMGSPDNSFAIEAVRMLGAQGWLEGKALKKAHLSRANLEGANLQKVNLEDARVPLANLRKVKFSNANLKSAYMQGANLESANLCGANLKGANLNDANLLHVHIDQQTQFDEATILPDCTYWSPGADISRFTDPEHRDFWRSHNPNSPANGINGANGVNGIKSTGEFHKTGA
jgi:hypothetical protein